MSIEITRLRAVQTIAGLTAAATLKAPADAQSTSIRLVTNPIEPGCEAFFARDNGFFDKAGLNVEITVAQPAGLVSSVAGGEYDIGLTTISTVALAHAKGLRFVLVAPIALVAPSVIPAGGIVVAAGSTISRARDFNGKVFACAALNSTGEYLCRAWIDKHGGDSTTMKFIELPFSEMAEALGSGRVEGCYLLEPFLSIAKRRGVVRQIVDRTDDAIASTYLASAWFATAQWARAHPALVASFASAIASTARWANANPAKVVPMVVNYLKADPALVAASPRILYGERIIDAQVQPWIDVTAKYANVARFPASDLR